MLTALPASSSSSYDGVLQSCKQALPLHGPFSGHSNQINQAGSRAADQERPEQPLLGTQQHAALLAALTGINTAATSSSQLTPGQGPATRPACLKLDSLILAEVLAAATASPVHCGQQQQQQQQQAGPITGSISSSSSRGGPLGEQLPPSMAAPTTSSFHLLKQLPPHLEALKLELPILPSAPLGPNTLDLVLASTTTKLQVSAKRIFTKANYPMDGPSVEDLLAADHVSTAEDTSILLPVPHMQDAATEGDVLVPRSDFWKEVADGCGCRPVSVAHLELYQDWSMIAPVPQHRLGALLPFPCCDQLEQLAADLLSTPAATNRPRARRPGALTQGLQEKALGLPPAQLGVGGCRLRTGASEGEQEDQVLQKIARLLDLRNVSRACAAPLQDAAKQTVAVQGPKAEAAAVLQLGAGPATGVQ